MVRLVVQMMLPSGENKAMRRVERRADTTKDYQQKSGVARSEKKTRIK